MKKRLKVAKPMSWAKKNPKNIKIISWDTRLKDLFGRETMQPIVRESYNLWHDKK